MSAIENEASSRLIKADLRSRRFSHRTTPVNLPFASEDLLGKQGWKDPVPTKGPLTEQDLNAITAAIELGALVIPEPTKKGRLGIQVGKRIFNWGTKEAEAFKRHMQKRHDKRMRKTAEKIVAKERKLERLSGAPKGIRSTMLQHPGMESRIRNLKLNKQEQSLLNELKRSARRARTRISQPEKLAAVRAGEVKRKVAHMERAEKRLAKGKVPLSRSTGGRTKAQQEKNWRERAKVDSQLKKLKEPDPSDAPSLSPFPSKRNIQKAASIIRLERRKAILIQDTSKADSHFRTQQRISDTPKSKGWRTKQHDIGNATIRNLEYGNQANRVIKKGGALLGRQAYGDQLVEADETLRQKGLLRSDMPFMENLSDIMINPMNSPDLGVLEAALASPGKIQQVRKDRYEALQRRSKAFEQESRRYRELADHAWTSAQGRRFKELAEKASKKSVESKRKAENMWPLHNR